MKIKAIER